jgi:hypothetical protein
MDSFCWNCQQAGVTVSHHCGAEEPPIDVEGTRRFPEFIANSCYTDCALLLWYTLLQTTSVLRQGRRLQLRSDGTLPMSADTETTFFPEKGLHTMRASLFAWLEAKLRLESVPATAVTQLETARADLQDETHTVRHRYHTIAEGKATTMSDCSDEANVTECLTATYSTATVLRQLLAPVEIIAHDAELLPFSSLFICSGSQLKRCVHCTHKSTPQRFISCVIDIPSEYASRAIGALGRADTLDPLVLFADWLRAELVSDISCHTKNPAIPSCDPVRIQETHYSNIRKGTPIPPFLVLEMPEYYTHLDGAPSNRGLTKLKFQPQRFSIITINKRRVRCDLMGIIRHTRAHYVFFLRESHEDAYGLPVDAWYVYDDLQPPYVGTLCDRDDILAPHMPTKKATRHNPNVWSHMLEYGRPAVLLYQCRGLDEP